MLKLILTPRVGFSSDPPVISVTCARTTPPSFSMGASRSAPHIGREIVSVLNSLMADMVSDYRPERHYMRGPGPKWREKHQPQRMPRSVAGLLIFRFAKVSI